MISTEERLKAFQEENNIYTKGPLSLVVQFTRLVQNKDFPLNPDDFQTSSKGQVAGLGGGNLKKILKEHGITQQLSAEGGRTSRGSMGLMIKYVDFLNAWNEEETVDFSIVEEFWAEQVREYFRNQPFVLTADTSKTIGANLDELFEQAKKRQKQNPGTQYLGTVLQHLVAAKLCLIMPENAFEIHGASVADAPTERSGRNSFWRKRLCGNPCPVQKNAEIQLHRAGSHIRSDHAVYRTDHHYVRRRRRAGTGDGSCTAYFCFMCSALSLE